MNIKCIRIIKSQNSIKSIAVSPNEKTIISNHFDTTVKLWNLHTGELIHTFDVAPVKDCYVAISPDGLNMACGGRDSEIRIWRS